MTTVPPEVLGTWALTISTPIGKMAVAVDLNEQDGVLTGTAQDRNATVPLLDIATAAGPQASSTRITWHQAVVKPMRLNLQFDVVVAGDTMTGFSRAGRLPRSAVHGERRAVSPGVQQSSGGQQSSRGHREEREGPGTVVAEDGVDGLDR